MGPTGPYLRPGQAGERGPSLFFSTMSYLAWSIFWDDSWMRNSLNLGSALGGSFPEISRKASVCWLLAFTYTLPWPWSWHQPPGNIPGSLGRTGSLLLILCWRSLMMWAVCCELSMLLGAHDVGDLLRTCAIILFESGAHTSVVLDLLDQLWLMITFWWTNPWPRQYNWVLVVSAWWLKGGEFLESLVYLKTWGVENLEGQRSKENGRLEGKAIPSTATRSFSSLWWLPFIWSITGRFQWDLVWVSSLQVFSLDLSECGLSWF